jgi:DNA-binding winged helix-turn-helix (wHTH) protein/alpha-beta hydrolase superfamily lysophospholipase
MIFVFGDCEIDPDRRELRRGGEAIHVEPQVFDVLIHLLQHNDRVVSKDELIQSVWGGRIVSEATLTSRVAAARRAIGDTGKQQARLRTIARRGFRFVSEVRQEAPHGRSLASAIASTQVAGPHPSNNVPPQEVRFVRTSDDVHLAVATVGDGPTLVKATNWLNHLEYDWRSPVWSPTLAHLSARHRLVRYDGRGLGLSDWDVADLSFEAYVRDLETVVDALELGRFPLLGISGGVALSIAYAARHPDRVSCLVLVAGFPYGWFKRGSAAEIAQREALITMIRHGWGQDNPAFHQLFTSLFVPGGTPEQHQWFKDLQRVTISVENAIRLARMFGEIDVAELLPRVTAPTLVLHSRHDARVPFEQGVRMAREIPKARFVALDSPNHIVLSHEPAWQRFVDEVCAFLNDANKESARSGSVILPGAGKTPSPSS